MKMYLTALLFSFVGLLQAQECDLLVDKTYPNGGFIKTTREQQIIKLTGHSLKFYLENLDGQMTLGVNWYISPKALPEGSNFDGKKPLVLIIRLEDGNQLQLTVQEPKPGSGTYKLKYADYMIGGLAVLSAEDQQKLAKSPIRSITENIYGVSMPPVDDIKQIKFFMNKITCVLP